MQVKKYLVGLGTSGLFSSGAKYQTVGDLLVVSIVLDHAKRYDTPRALWASVLVAALTWWKASDRFACDGEH